MKHDSRGVIRIGDKTTHGGEVISASSGTVVMGKLAALDGDLSVCPQCKGKFALRPDGSGARHEGKFYAYHNDVTECGALLISSIVFDNSTGSSEQAHNQSAYMPDIAKLIDEDHWVEFRMVDGLGNPISNLSFELIDPAGATRLGMLDADGYVRVEPVKSGLCIVRFPQLAHTMAVVT